MNTYENSRQWENERKVWIAAFAAGLYHGVERLTLKQVGAFCGLSEGAVSRHIQSLASKGIVDNSRRRGVASIRLLVCPTQVM